MIIALVLSTALHSAQPPVRFEADTSKYEVETRRMELIGNVSITRLGNETESEIVLKADTVAGKIDGIVNAGGDVRILYGGRTAKAENGLYDFATSRGRFENVRLVEDSWLVRAKVLQVTGTDRFVLEDVDATACDYDPPHYHFRLSRASYDGKRLAFSGATMYIGKFPVFYWPYFSLRPAGGRPPFRIRAGKSDHEGYFVKTAYLYSLGDSIDGEIKADWRSHRGWGYGTENAILLKRGYLDLDLYRIDERDRGGRGTVRARYRQELMDRLTSRAHVYYVTDGRFLQDYRFDSYAAEPDPISSASLTWRGDGWATVLRADVNQQRKAYDLVERIPEMRWFTAPRGIVEKFFIESRGGFTAFRHSHPYDSGVTALARRDNPSPSNLVTLVRGDAAVRIRRPIELGGGVVFTPEAGIEALAYADDTSGTREPYRIMPSAGFALTAFRRMALSENLSLSSRPTLEFLERGPGWRNGAPQSIIEHIDRKRDARLLRLVMDHGILTKKGGRWSESLRLRLDGGFDFDREGDAKYLPITGKVSLWPFRNTSIDAGTTYDPNRLGLRDAWIDLGYSHPGFTLNAGYVYRKGEAGLLDNENVSFGATANLWRRWTAGLNLSYNISMSRMDYASYRLSREFHDWIVGVEVTDQRSVDRWDFRVSAEMKFP